MTDAKITYARQVPENVVFAMVTLNVSIYVRRVNMSSLWIRVKRDLLNVDLECREFTIALCITHCPRGLRA